MKIKILTSCSGLTFSYSEGEVVDAPKDIGTDLVKVGFAEEVKTNSRDTKTKKDIKQNSKQDTDTKIGIGDADAVT